MARACVAHLSQILLSLILCLIVSLILGAAVPAVAAVRWSADGEWLGGGGYDSNLFLQVAASPDSPNFHAYSGGFLRANPVLDGALAGEGYRLQLRYGADLVQTFGAGALSTQDAVLSLALPELGPVGLRLAVTGGRFDAGRFESDRFWSWGGRGQVTVRLSDQMQGSARYEIDARRFGDPTTVLIRSDLGQSARLGVDGTLSNELIVSLEAEYMALRADLVDPTQASGSLNRVRAGASARYTPRPTTTLGASLWAGRQSAGGTETDRQVGGDAAISVRVTTALDVIGRYDLFIDRSQAAGPSYARHVLTVGLVGHVTGPRGGVGAAAAVEPAGDQAPRVERGRVRFRLRAPAAGAVVVIGSWNDWLTEPAQQRLRPTRDPALWEGWVDMGAGEHRYHFLVDDRPTRPMDAPRYRPDGFGGEDGVVEVPGN